MPDDGGLLSPHGQGRFPIVSAATYVEDHGFSPFDALHLVESNGDLIVSSDDAYEGSTSRLDLKSVDEETLRNH